MPCAGGDTFAIPVAIPTDNLGILWNQNVLRLFKVFSSTLEFFIQY